MTAGSVVWAAVPGDPVLASCITGELDTYVRLLNEEHARARAANTESAMAALLESLED